MLATPFGSLAYVLPRREQNVVVEASFEEAIGQTFPRLLIEILCFDLREAIPEACDLVVERIQLFTGPSCCTAAQVNATPTFPPIVFAAHIGSKLLGQNDARGLWYIVLKAQ